MTNHYDTIIIGAGHIASPPVIPPFRYKMLRDLLNGV